MSRASLLGSGAAVTRVRPAYARVAATRAGQHLADSGCIVQGCRRRQDEVHATAVNHVNVGVPTRKFGILEVAHVAECFLTLECVFLLLCR